MIPRALLLTALLAFPVQTAPLLQAGDSRVTLTLYDEPCALFGLVRNLPFRVVGVLKDIYEGCYIINAFNIVTMFFDDLTAIALPLEAFRQVRTT